MSDEARQTPGEPESRDPWAPPEERGAPAAAPADAGAGEQVSFSKPGRDPWAPPEDAVPGGAAAGSGAAAAGGAGAGASVHEQSTVPSMPSGSGSGSDGGPAAGPGYGYPGAGAGPADAVPPPPVSPDGPGQMPYGYPGGAPAYPGYPGYPGGGQPGYGGWGAPVQPSNGMGIAAMVLGIISVSLFCIYGVVSIITGILAVIFGVIGRRRVREGVATNHGMALSGIITGAIGIVVGVVVLGLIIWGISLASNVDEYEPSWDDPASTSLSAPVAPGR